MKLFLLILSVSYVLALDKDWWKHSIMYEIYTPSFKDSNGDGWGDLKGITSKLDYVKDLGVDTVYLTPFNPSPMLDTGYDVSDYLEINPLFGTMADFDNLMRELKKRDMKLIMDFVLNHSSDKHEWFEKSVNKTAPYTDYYVWRDPKGFNESGKPIPPNNWCAWFGQSAWTWNEKRQQFYYHAFLAEQPDLNYRCPHVVKEMKKTIKFWFEKGVAGMRLDAAMMIMEDATFADEEFLEGTKDEEKQGCRNLKNDKRSNVNDTYVLIREIRAYVDQLNDKFNDFERIIIVEVFGDKEQTKAYYGNSTHSGAHYPFNYMIEVRFDYLSPSNLKSIIEDWMEITPSNSTPNWLIGCHDLFRASFKFIQEYVNVLLTLISMLPGVTVLYYGEEIGMTSGVIRPNQRRLFSEYARTPMQWDGSTSAGFSSNSKTWLPTNPNYWRLNLKKQISDPHSMYHFVKSLLALKKSDPIKYGTFEKMIFGDWLLVLKRTFKDDEIYIVVLNFGTEREKIYLDKKIPDLPSMLKVCLTSPNSGFKNGAVVLKKNKRSFVMKPMSAVILCQKIQPNMIEPKEEHMLSV